MQRYSDTVELINRGGKKRSYETMYYPEFPFSTTDIYLISKKSDRMDLLAHEYYGDSRFWWVISRSNSLPMGTMVIPAGHRIRIPYPINSYDIYELLKSKQF